MSVAVAQVRKRDGRIVDFDRERITNAIFKAAQAVDQKDGRRVAERISDNVVATLERDFFRQAKIPSVEEIQDLVEAALIEKGYVRIAKAYILYREQRAQVRDTKKLLLDGLKLMDDYLEWSDWRVNENANMNYSLQGLNFHVASSISARYWLHKIYPPEAREAHVEGDFHIHDISILAAYCCGWDLQDLLIRGFGGVLTKTESKPPRHLRSALGQIVNFFYTLQGESAGAQAFSNFDTLLAPFVRYDGLDYRGVKQAVQEFIFNINVPTRVGFQCPFTNLTMDLVPPSTLRDRPVIIGGEFKEETYGDFQHEMDLLNRVFAEVMLEGDARGRVFSVDGDALCPIKNSGRFKLVRIGEFIDDFMGKSPPVFMKERDCEVLDVRDLNLKCMGLKNGKLGWQRINYLIRHPQSEVLKITTVGGFNIRVTPAHSVLVLKDGRIQSYPAGKLKKGNYLVAPQKFPQEESKVDSISLAHEFIKREKEGGIYIRGVQKEGKLYKETRLCEGKFRYHYKVEVFPLENISAKLDEFDLSKARLSLRGSKIKVFNYLPITKDLVEFLGWYCAEGSAERGRYGGVSLGLNLQKERKRAHYSAEVIRRIFPDVPVCLREVKERNLIQIRVHSKLVRRIIKQVFEIENGEGKRVPPVIFELDPELKRVFLESYFKGDAWITKNVIATSVSRELIYGISTILKQLNVFHTLEEYSWKGKKRYRVLVFNNRDLKAKSSYTISKIPVKESGLEEIAGEILRKEPFYLDNLGRRYRNTKKRILQKFGISNQRSTNQENVEKIANYAQNLNIKLPAVFEELLEGELSFFRIKRIEKVNSTNGMVYDFSTESETFVADQLVVHNTFPIPTYNISKDFGWENSVPDAIWQMTAKYGIPYFGNFVNSDMSPDDARSMCCRLRLDNRELRKRGGGYFGANPLTGSIGVVTINLARLGYLATDEADFFRRLERLMEIAKTSLEIKRKTLERFTERGLYPYARHYLASIKKIGGAYWANHFSTIGLNGMNEACLNFLRVSIAHPDGKAFALKTLHFMREKLKGFQAETGNLYNLEATPAEGASYRLAKADKARFPDIITAGTDEAPYYTNSTHLPVGYTDDVFEALEHQDDLQVLYTGGTVFHAFVGERIDDWRQARLLVRRIAENFRLPYYTLTPTFSICPVHGYVSGEHPYCPYDHTPDELKAVTHEDSKVPCEVYSRIVGYLRPIRNWNVGKKQEFAERREYVVQARTVG
jgi:ribonucleoside-triphosphate reductase